MTAFTQSRSTTIKADAAKIHNLINDFHNWAGWSPWEKLDPQLQRAFTGAPAGVGSHYAWEGNNKVGTGTMEITGSTPTEITIDLQFIKPFKASNTTVFTLTPVADGTKVDWTMSGDRTLLFTIMGKLFFDKAIAKDFDKGLASLKEIAEA